MDYRAANAGGMALEAELGVGANSIPLPDYLCWEVKGLAAWNFLSPAPSSVITVIMVEPCGGFYSEHGANEFVSRFGYPDRSGKPDRLNFGGAYRFGVPVPLIGARLLVQGYAPDTGIEPDGRLVLVMAAGTEGAVWPFAELLEHWTQKPRARSTCRTNGLSRTGDTPIGIPRGCCWGATRISLDSCIPSRRAMRTTTPGAN